MVPRPSCVRVPQVVAGHIARGVQPPAPHDFSGWHAGQRQVAGVGSGCAEAEAREAILSGRSGQGRAMGPCTSTAPRCWLKGPTRARRGGCSTWRYCRGPAWLGISAPSITRCRVLQRGIRSSPRRHRPGRRVAAPTRPPMEAGDHRREFGVIARRPPARQSESLRGPRLNPHQP